MKLLVKYTSREEVITVSEVEIDIDHENPSEEDICKMIESGDCFYISSDVIDYISEEPWDIRIESTKVLP
nr:MAG TPA: hypothetical protein [Caudoviricetes sp.]